MASLTSRAAVTWRYLTRGKAKHAVPLHTGSITGHETYAVCGTGPAWFDPTGWLGTGCQFEYEAVERLPECRRCARLLDPVGGDDRG